MSFLHFDAITAASDIGIVALQNLRCDDAAAGATNVSIMIKGDGSVWCTEGAFDSFVYNWIDPTSGNKVSPLYQIERSNTVGHNPNGPADGVWVEVYSFLISGWSINSGGSGYLIGDTIEWVGGTHDTPVQATVSTVSGTTITGLTISDFGKYGELPTDPIASTTNGSGINATFNASNNFRDNVDWSFSASYPGTAYVEFDVSIRRGTGSTLSTAHFIMEADSS